MSSSFKKIIDLKPFIDAPNPLTCSINQTDRAPCVSPSPLQPTLSCPGKVLYWVIWPGLSKPLQATFYRPLGFKITQDPICHPMNILCLMSHVLRVSGSLEAADSCCGVTPRPHHYPHGQHPAHPLGPPPSPRLLRGPVPLLSPRPRGPQCRAEDRAPDLLRGLRAPGSHASRGHDGGLHRPRGLRRLPRGIRGGCG